MSKKEKKDKKKCPVETGGDFRAVVRSAAAETRADDASNGVSGKRK